ncbi:MAG: preprotein translocase subunit SecE [Verrucomicrobia bacterium]|jgi:preprotein translocase subunit SecE|nr:preprotein translocase subunit SecE [Verrucomicrobiota bacterium]
MEAWKIGGSWLWTAVVGGLTLTTVFLLFRYRSSIAKFLGEVRGELAKCSWPWDPTEAGVKKYRELIDSTAVVAMTTLVLAAYTSGFDFLITRVVGWLVKF